MKKLSLNKQTIARLDHPEKIYGGDVDRCELSMITNTSGAEKPTCVGYTCESPASCVGVTCVSAEVCCGWTS
jgi:hypothetical protein